MENEKLSSTQSTEVRQQLQFPLDKTSQDIIRRYSGGEAFPVGAIFMSVVSTNPSSLLGYGTWTAFGAGRVPVGVDSGDTDFDTVEETGGEKVHFLNESELPAHYHSTLSAQSAGSSTNQANGAGSATLTEARTGLTGGNGGHNNLQPYICVYMWKRTA